jgi:hypothetical protein
MSLATKQAILASQDWDSEEFEVQKWGTVRIRALSALERLNLVREFNAGQVTNEKAFEFFVRLIAISVIDEAGRQVFDMNGDLEALQTRSWKRLQEVADRIMVFNGMNKAAAEDDEKN